MANYTIKNIGTAEVDKKKISTNFSIDADEFFKRFATLVSDILPSDVIPDLKAAINTGSEKYNKKYQNQLEEFFDQVEKQAKNPTSTSMGFDADEREEAAEAEQMKSQAGSKTIHYEDRDKSTPGIDTYDARTGKKEGEIILGENGEEGLLVPLEIIEKVKASYEFNGDESKEDERNISGLFKITNPSERNKIWDVDISFQKDQKVTIDDALHFKNLDSQATEEVEYEIETFKEPVLNVKEFISTLNDPDTETYSLSTTEDNTVLFKLTATNQADYDLHDVIIKKEIQDGYMDVKINSTSIGDAELASSEVIWKIDHLEANGEATIAINMTIKIAGADVKARTGKVSATYIADSALTGLKIDKFDAYSDNFVGIEELQQDDNPDMYTCSVIFKNKSDFQLELVNLDIINAETQVQVLDIDPKDIPVIASSATWKSVEWETETSDGMEPEFHKTVEFFLLSERKISTEGIIDIDDIELAVALMSGYLAYSVKHIASYRVVKFDALLEVQNIGGADLNEVILEETIQPGYIAPKPEEIELYVVRPPEDYEPGTEIKQEVDEDGNPVPPDWENLGDEIAIDPSLIEITPNDQESESEHVLRIKLENLQEHSMGMFLPGMIIRAKYPITANKVPKDTEYISNVKYLANTYPPGVPMEIIPDEIRIPVLHIRRRTVKGKVIRALAIDGEYEITLAVENIGETEAENIQIRDVVPHNFEYSDFNMEPEKYDNLEGKDMLVWTIDSIAPGDTTEISYKIKGTGEDYKASEAQFSV